MNVLRAVAFSILFSVSGNAAQSQQIDGNELLETCTATSDLAMLGFCIGYIIGQIEGQSFGAFAVLNKIEPGENTTEVNEKIVLFLNHCTPANASNSQLKDVVVKYLLDNPETRHNSARYLVWESLTAAFPCP